MKPELDFSSGFYGLAPDNVKVKKTVRLRPLPLELGASLVYNIESRGIKWKLNCKETLLGGKVTADIPNRALEYRCGGVHCMAAWACAHSCGMRAHTWKLLVSAT